MRRASSPKSKRGKGGRQIRGARAASGSESHAGTSSLPDNQDTTRGTLNALRSKVEHQRGVLSPAALESICQKLGLRGHVAVMREPYLGRVLRGEKTIESRLAISRTPPFGRVRFGDVIFLKETSGPLRGIAIVERVESLGPLTPRELARTIASFEDGLRLEPDWIHLKRNSRYATLLFLGATIHCEPRHFDKTDRRGWVVLADASQGAYQHQLLVNPDCARGLHFIEGSTIRNALGHLLCRDCGGDVINWGRLYERNLADIPRTIAELRKDQFRNEWWSREFDAAALERAHHRLRGSLRAAAIQRIRQSVGRVYGGARVPFRDGRQTPFTGNVLYYAQHAMATCCRKCIERWHGIPNGRDLMPEEVEYLAILTARYVSTRLPRLAVLSQGASSKQRSRDTSDGSA